MANKYLMIILALHHAALEKRLDVIELLLKHEELDVEAISNDRNNVLHYLVRHTFTPDEQYAANNLIHVLVQRGAQINGKNEIGETPLFLAVLKGESLATFS